MDAESLPQSSSAHLVVLAGHAPALFDLNRGEFIMGRAPDIHFRLEHMEVSRQHCKITWDGERCWITDLGSSKGTSINGTPITDTVLLRPGDKFALGPVLMEFRLGAGSETTTQTNFHLPVFVNGQPSDTIPLKDRMLFGRDDHVDVILRHPSISREHLRIEKTNHGYRAVDLRSTAGSLVNGQRFDARDLLVGDRIQLGPFFFQFDGQFLHQVSNLSGGSLDAINLHLRSDQQEILKDISVHIPACRFVGIIGPSGAGKSSLLNVLSGMKEPAGGNVFVNGRNIYELENPADFGYVPQEDIVHSQLTPEQALTFAAQLRLPKETPSHEIQKLVYETLRQLGLQERAATPIWRLSGGQRKRVSVGVELLARPPILFLDEPSSGLDPATEFKLMELLRDLAGSGCTVVCTTHIMENAYLIDQLLVLHQGHLLFEGSLQEVRSAFQISKLADLYDKLEEQPAADWLRALPSKPKESSNNASTSGAPIEPKKRAAAFPILLHRLWKILSSDIKNFIILLGQPLLIASLVSWVSDDASLLLFFAYISTLWFGCSNAAQEVVSEIPIYRRERIVGLGRHSYLLSKFLFLTGITLFQTFLLYGFLRFSENPLPGNHWWQLAGLTAISGASVGIGLAISALAKTVMQAVLTVPLLLIPLILFSGYTVPAHEMKPRVALVSQSTPTFATQSVMDISFLWGKKLERETLSDHWTAFRNVNRNKTLKTGEFYTNPQPGIMSLMTSMFWIVATYALAWFGLKSRERG